MIRATAHWLVGRRAIVAGAGDAADTVTSALAEAGAAIERLAAPSTDAPEIAQAFESIAAKLGGPIDLLVHAGVAMPAVSAEAIDLDAWRASLSADIDGRFLFAAEFTRRLLVAEAGGSILYLMPSPDAGVGRSASATADGALANLVKSLAVEWGRDGIRINAIRSRACEPGGLADVAVKDSLGYLAAYLSSGYSAYVTGCLMGVDEL
jgi:NAD(P)-dependent dehydrogenase (short-subunit alcohol dehydrogenase family)